jgi:peptidase C13-like protein
VRRYGFAPRDITVLSFNGTTDTQEGVNTIWPGDGTAYQIVVNGPGDRAAFEAAVDALKPRLREDDLLFVHTTSHGDNFGSGSFLSAYPDWGQYDAGDFAAKLGELPRYQSLVVLMEQCNAGGFSRPVITHSTARATSVAAAAVATRSSHASPDLHWDSFARDWFAAQAGHDPYGAALAFNPDANGDGKIEAAETFGYARTIGNPSDSPQFDESSPAGGQTWLGRTYIAWWWWGLTLREVLSRPYRELPEAEYYARLNKLQPELAKLAAALDDQSAVLRQETAALAGELVAGAFGAPR